jgi:acyl carrier protein
MLAREIEDQVESFLRATFRIASDDPDFDRTVDLYEHGYVDSVGIVELVAWLEKTFGVAIPESDMLSDDFSTVEGLGRIVGGRLSS